MAALSQPDEASIARFLAPHTGSTRESYAATLTRWLMWCIAADVHVLDGTRHLIEQWAASLRREGRSRTTVATMLVPVCGFYRWAYQEGLTARDESAHVRRPSRPRRSNQRFLSRGESSRFLAAALEAGAPVDLLVHLLLLNGLRLGEVLSARTEHVERGGGKVVLRLPDRKAGVMDRVGLPDETVALLPEQGPWLLGARRVQPATVYRWMDALSDVAGLEFRARPHMLRATFVTQSLDAGIPARDIIASAGWVDGTMLAYYDRAHASVERNASYRLADYLRG